MLNTHQYNWVIRCSSMRKPICVVCGRPATVESLCEEHYAERYELFTIEPINVEVCEKCESVRDRMWERLPLEIMLQRMVRHAVKSSGKLESVDVQLHKVGYNYTATVTATGTIAAGVEKTGSKKVDIRIKRIKCPSCVKLLGHYHEAVLQIRGARAEQLVEAIENLTAGMPKRIERIKEGWNIYFVDKGDARTAVNEVSTALRRAREAKPEVIRSHKVVGHKLGRNLMRDFYAIR